MISSPCQRVPPNDKDRPHCQYLESCVRNSIDKHEIFIDEGISGAVENRPVPNRLMDMVDP